jgi:hypothetical protein
MTWLKPALLTMIVVAIMSSFAPQAEAQRERFRGELRGTTAEPLAGGKASWEMRPDRVRFSCECEDLAVASEIFVFVEGDFVGSAVVDAFGVADLNLDSRLGDTVPPMEALDHVDVYDEQGTWIMYGTLRNR